jgi:SnoaL-like domain
MSLAPLTQASSRWQPDAPLGRAVGIRPQPDQVADEMAIRGLAHAFADAVNRRDAAAFESLWDESGVWQIGAPLHAIAEGSTGIAAQFVKLWDALEFVVQQVHSGIVTIEGDRATFRWFVHEIGQRRRAGPYNSHAFYEDEMVKRDGSWRFVRRNYRHLWLDLSSTIGGSTIK